LVKRLPTSRRKCVPPTPDIPWRLVIATRNRLIHAYLGIDDDTIWSIIQDDIPVLISALEVFKEEAK